MLSQLLQNKLNSLNHVSEDQQHFVPEFCEEDNKLVVLDDSFFLSLFISNQFP